MATAVVRVYEISSLEQRLLALEERSGRFRRVSFRRRGPLVVLSIGADHAAQDGRSFQRRPAMML